MRQICSCSEAAKVGERRAQPWWLYADASRAQQPLHQSVGGGGGGARLPCVGPKKQQTVRFCIPTLDPHLSHDGHTLNARPSSFRRSGGLCGYVCHSHRHSSPKVMAYLMNRRKLERLQHSFTVSANLCSLFGFDLVRGLTVRGCLHASQSLVSVGKRPMLQHLYRPNAMPASWHTTNSTLGSNRLCPGDANLENAVSTATRQPLLVPKSKRRLVQPYLCSFRRCL